MADQTVIRWERWRLRHALRCRLSAPTAEAVNFEQSIANDALRALVGHGCDEAAELRAAQEQVSRETGGAL